MPTAEQMQQRHEKVFAAVADIKRNGLDIKSIEYGLRASVLAHALAVRLITPADVPPRWAMEVAERLLKEEPGRVRDTAAFKGTDVHALLERKDNGEIVEVPENLANHVEAWRQCRDYYGFETLLTEFTVFSIKHDYAGTGDWLGYSRRYPEWGLILLDYKTSESGIWPDIALQLAALRYGDFIGEVIFAGAGEPVRFKSIEDPTASRAFVGYDAEGNAVRRYREVTDVLPAIQTFGGLQITGNGYKFVRATVSEDTFRVFLSAINVARWKTEGEQWALDETAEFVPLAVAS